jgi:uncharacterized protein YcaQ
VVTRPASLAIDEARRIALSAHGFDKPRPKRVDSARLSKVLTNLGVLQLDFVNVLVPAHYLIPFSRVGSYDRALLDAVIYRSGEFVEVMAHEASAAYAESGVKQSHVAASLADELRLLAGWLGLEAGIEVSQRGDLSRPLRGAILASRGR